MRDRGGIEAAQACSFETLTGTSSTPDTSVLMSAISPLEPLEEPGHNAYLWSNPKEV
ncbi:hypothetical protein LB572_04960 [Mesorhizobium sp. BH1-1-5]|uniref:hypothetical protein n=1 Tax=Mesorhizobium sp. BH1-1-5 TaxID=2876661 RepID=UPI001CCF7C8A|nr:hypothetical protein [Mesorhizobium sp. BH1-1-5]MBZ9986444.1 hypothetical protein [Mesorhizobium sp. BH1-1-5]